MKRKFNLLALATGIIFTLGAVFSSQDVKAVNDEGGETGTKKLIQCQIVEEGTIIMHGGRCESGVRACFSNPCY
jgi:hypothetical protein